MNRNIMIDMATRPLDAFWGALVALLGVTTLAPHLGVILATVMHAGLLLFVLPRPSKMEGAYDAEQVAAYRHGRWGILRTSGRNLIIWFFMLILTVVWSNSAGIPALPTALSVSYVGAIWVEAGRVAAKANSLIAGPIEYVVGIVSRKPTQVPTDGSLQD